MQHETKEQQQFFMRWAIKLGQKGRLTTSPNPWVGCVIVKDGEILGEGYHVAPGTPHAEVRALEQAGPLARGATAYVSLEPCSHHGRTPPCVQVLIEAGVKKVVLPFEDPDPLVSGRGIQTLKEAGIEVVLGVAQQEAAEALEPYLFHRKTNRPFCILKAAISLDGKTAAEDGSSKWITGESARKDVHLLRAASQAVLIGSQTAIIDRPELTIRGVQGNQPLRVLLDSSGKTPPEGPLFDTSLAPTLIFTTVSDRKKEWEEKGAEVLVTKPNDGKVDLNTVLDELGRRNVIQLLVEGGGEIHSCFVKQQLAQQFVVYIGNCLLGPAGKPFLPTLSIASIDQAPRWKLESLKRFENDVRLDYRL